ncbi:MAG: formylglycine-generating enzyme family protein [Methylococcales bacterium]
MLRLLRLGNDARDIATLAELAGYELLTTRVESRIEHEVSLSLDSQVFFEASTENVEQETIPTENAAQSACTAWFWQPVSREPVVPGVEEKEPPLWWRQGLPVGQRPEQPKPAGQISEVSLVHWPRLSAFLRHQCMELRDSSSPDEMRLVRLLASAQNLKRIPRKSFRRWPHRVVLVLDRAAELFPVQSDFRLLEKRLVELLGAKLTLIALDENEFGETGFDRVMERARLSPEELWEASWLILSDLGTAVTKSPRQTFWQSFLTWLRELPVRTLPLVLMPTSEYAGFPGLNSLARIVVWDIARPLRIAQVFDNFRSGRDVTGLLAMLSMATEARPRLLRKLRLLFSGQGCDIGSELAVWNHEQVLRCAPVCFVHPDQRVDYQRLFKDLPPDLRTRVHETIESDHAHAWPFVRDLEKLLFSAREQADADPDYIGDVIFTLVKHPESPDHAIRLRWAKQLMEETDPELIERSDKLAALDEAISIAEAAQGGSGKTRDRRFDFLTRHFPAKPYQLLQTGSEFRWVQDTASGGSPIVRNALCGPFVKVTDETERSVRYVSVDCGLPAISENLSIMTADARIELQRAYRPEWAFAIGRDERGLFAVIRADGRRVEWCEPGFVLLKRKDGHETARWGFEKGFWHDSQTGGAHGIELVGPHWAAEFGVDSIGVYAGFEVDGLVQRLRWMMPGMFAMGSPSNEYKRYDDETRHDVILSQGFWLADTACTQALWMAVMDKNPSRFQGKDRSVEQISWDDVQEFLTRLNRRVPGLNATLPTEAQWEYACRAGTMSPFSFGETVNTEQANYNGYYPYRDQDPKGEYREKTVDVKALPRNAWGLYQMHGNVWEWCRDGLREYASGSVVDPLGPEGAGPRVLRGGSCYDSAGNLRCAYRSHWDRAYRFSIRGFRLSRGPELQAGAAVPVKKNQTEERRAEPPRSRAQNPQETGKGWVERLRDGFLGGRNGSEPGEEP